jgi:hypothetical protein
MAPATNAARGEVAFAAAGQSFKLTATAESVAALEAAVNALGLRDLIRRVNDVNLATVRAGLIYLDAAAEELARKKVAKLALPDLVDAATPLAAALLFGMQRGNGEAAKTK